MNIDFWQGVLEATTFFISVFILWHAYHFLRKSHRHRDRLPWDLLLGGVVIFFIAELMVVVRILFNWWVPGLRELLFTVFAAFILLSFIMQHQLLHQNKEIHIHHKDGPKPK